MKKKSIISILAIFCVLLVGIFTVTAFAVNDKPNSTVLGRNGTYNTDDKYLSGFKMETGLYSNNPDNNGLSYNRMIVTEAGQTKGRPYIYVGPGYKSFDLEKVAQTGYVTVDFDMCTSSEYLPTYGGFVDFTVGKDTRWVDSQARIPVSRDGTVTATIVTKDGTKDVVKKLGISPFDWHHWLMIYDLDRNIKATYIDGELIQLCPWNSQPTMPVTEIKSFRMEFPADTTDYVGCTTNIANAVTRIYSREASLDYFTVDVDPYVNIKDVIEPSDELIYGPNYPDYVPDNLYEVEGNKYSSFEKAKMIAEYSKSKTIKILANVSIVHEIDKEIVIDTNGYKFKYVSIGYESVKNGQFIKFEKSDKTWKVTYRDGDNIVEEKQVPIGSYLPIVDSIVSKNTNGISYIFQGWSLSETDAKNGKIVNDNFRVTKDVTLYASYIEGTMMIETMDGSKKIFNDADFMTAYNRYYSYFGAKVLHLYKDFTFTFDKQVVLHKNVVIDLHGFTLTADQKFFVGDCKHFELKNGTLVLNRNEFYRNEKDIPTIFDNLNIQFNDKGGYSDFMQLRAGETTIKNCNITLNENNHFIKASYNGKSYSVNIENTTFTAAHPTGAESILHHERGGGAENTITINVNLNNVTVNGKFKNILQFTNHNNVGTTTLNVSISGNCNIAEEANIYANSNMGESTVVFKNGTKLNKLIRCNGFKSVQYGYGQSVLAKGDNIFVVCDKDETGIITWSDGNFTLSETWQNGVLPIPPETKNYKFVTDENITLTYGDKVYSGTFGLDSLDLKQNLTLYTDFTFNIYVKVTEDISYINFNGIEYKEVESLPKWNNYYVISLSGINPLNAGKELKLKIGRYDLTADYTLSIPSYAKSILDGNFSKEAKELVANAIVYIDSAYIAYNKVSEPDYLNILSIKDVVDKNKTTEQIPDVVDSMSNVANALESAQLKLDTATKIRFNINKGYTGEIKIAYIKNESPIELIYNIENGLYKGNNYIEIDERAFELTKDFTITVESKIGVYSLASYYGNIKTDKQFEPLIKALYSYAKSAEAYRCVK